MPPQATPSGDDTDGTALPAVSLRIATLVKRSDFLKAARSHREHTQGFVLQARKRVPGEAEGIRVGFTCSKKVGNAVARNRAKRRLREVARLHLPHVGLDGLDYVLIGRAGATAALPFAALVKDFRRAAEKLNSNLS